MKLSKKNVVFAALGVFSVAALAMTAVTVKSSYKFHQGNILKKDMGYCNLNGYCIPGEELSAEERSHRLQVAVLSQYSPNGTYVGVGDDKLLWFPEIEDSIFSYASRNKPLSVPPIYLTTLERLNNYRSQGLPLAEGKTLEVFAKKIDALVLEKEEAIATGKINEKVSMDFNKKEQELLAAVLFKDPSLKTSFQFSDLAGVKNPEKFAAPSSGAIRIVRNLIEQGGVLSMGETIESVAREVDVALSGRSLASERLDVVTERFDSAVVCRLPGSEGNDDVIMLPPKIELEMPNGDGPYLSAPKNIPQLERVKSVEYADVIKGLTGNPLEKAFGDTKDTVIKYVLVKVATKAGLALTTGGAGVIVDLGAFNIGDLNPDETKYFDDSGLSKKEKAKKIKDLEQVWEKLHKMQSREKESKARLKRARNVDAINKEFAGTAFGGETKSPESNTDTGPQKTFVEQSSQGTAESNTLEGKADDVMEQINGQPQKIMLPAGGAQSPNTNSGGGDSFNPEKGPNKNNGWPTKGLPPGTKIDQRPTKPHKKPKGAGDLGNKKIIS